MVQLIKRIGGDDVEIIKTSNDTFLNIKKNADKKRNRIIIPKFFIDKNGYSYYMEIYEDKIILKPAKKEGK